MSLLVLSCKVFEYAHLNSTFFFLYTMHGVFLKVQDTVQSILKQITGFTVKISVFNISHTECYHDSWLFKTVAQFTMQELKTTTIFRTPQQTNIFSPILPIIFFKK